MHYPESGSTTGHGDPHDDLDFLVAGNRGIEPFSRLRPLTVNQKQDSRIEPVLRIVKQILQVPPSGGRGLCLFGLTTGILAGF